MSDIHENFSYETIFLLWLIAQTLLYIYCVDNFTTCICGYIQSHNHTYSGGRDRLQKDSNSYQNPQLRHCDQTENPVDCTPDFYKGAPPLP